MNTPTPTPRTDAAWSATFDSEEISAGRTARALRECSQQLEAELAALTAERDRLRAALALGQKNCDDAYEDLRDERDAARVELATCKGTSEWLLESLRAEVQRLKSDGAASAFVDMACRASRAETEVERLRSDRDCEKRLRKDAEELRENAIARAERAEAEVSKITDALDMMREEFMRIIACPGCNAEIEDLANRAQLKLIQRVPVITQRDRAEAELGNTKERALTLANWLDQAQAELAAERARLDWLESDAGVDWQWSDAARTVSRASIDAFMKEEAK